MKQQATHPAKVNLKNIKKFIQGWIRYIIYKLYLKKKLMDKVSDSFTLLPEHKREQFEYRLVTMNQTCLKQGSCVVCGCSTPQLQMADAACEGNCYPEMMNEENWNKYKLENDLKFI